jgi:hypothetical protein
VLKGVTVDLSKALVGKKLGSMRIYDPWTDHWSETKVKKGKIALPAFSRSIVIRLEN